LAGCIVAALDGGLASIESRCRSLRRRPARASLSGRCRATRKPILPRSHEIGERATAGGPARGPRRSRRVAPPFSGAHPVRKPRAPLSEPSATRAGSSRPRPSCSPRGT
jgi:hypothetical protein